MRDIARDGLFIVLVVCATTAPIGCWRSSGTAPGASAVVASAVVPACTPALQKRGDALLTADNAYIAYVGLGSGEGLRAISDGIRGDWTQAKHEPLGQLNPGDYLYVLAWDLGGPQMLIGQLTLPDGAMVVTSIDAWVSAVANIAPPTSPPEPAALLTTIATAAWRPTAVSAPSGTGPWGAIAGFGNCAQFIWHDSFNDPSIADGKAVLFRTARPLLSATTGRTSG